MNIQRQTTPIVGNPAVAQRTPRVVRSTQYSRLDRQRGFTVIELGVVLLVIGVLSVAVFQTLSGMVSDAKFSAMGDQLVASTLRLQQRYITTPAHQRYNGMTLGDEGTARTLTEGLREVISDDKSQLHLSDTGTAALGSSSASGGTGESNLRWILASLEREECKILIRKLAPPARVILNSTGIIRSRPGNDLLLESEIDDTCDEDEPNNTFQAVF